MAPLSGGKRPFPGWHRQDFFPLGPPSSPARPRAKTARKSSREAKSASAIDPHDDDDEVEYVGAARAGGGSPGVIDLLDDDADRSDGEVEIVGAAKKTVRFSEIEHEVFYFKCDPTEQSPPPLAVVGENEQASDRSSGVRPSSERSRATADYTVISSRHGRARRGLRRITKHDLRSAVKYGQRVPAHGGRWKFLHKGLVYITDPTCTHEITSYREATKIDPYPLSIAMMENHTELKRILDEEPYLCTGHTYIVMDQSGSMRNSDVDGFPSRSHAAYGCLSLEFISERLSQRPNQHDLFAESVTVIEMREEGEAVFERAPFDWVLFNRLLKRPNIARPSLGGNYIESLTLAKDMILDEYNKLLEDGSEHGELPHFSLVFLSDGRPSDRRPDFAQLRSRILKSLVDCLKDKFLFYAMGIGARETKFDVLQSMADTVAENGGSGQFVHAGLSTIKLSQTFSQISSTLTSHRTTLLGGGNSSNGNGGNKVKKDFTMRDTGKIVGKRMPSQKYLVGKGHSISRYRFDKASFEGGKDPWKEFPLANHGANGVEIETAPFGKGSERLAYRFHEIKHGRLESKRLGRTMVAKNSVHLNESETRDGFHQDFALVQTTAYDLAERYNTAVRNAPSLQSKMRESRPPELKFMLCHVYTIKDNTTKEEKGYLVERMLPGKFTKYNSNNGYVKKGALNTGTLELVSGEVKLEEFVQAFSHWVYVHTDRKMIVCDLQGVLNEEGRYPEFQLTDPAICTTKGQRFGKTDMRLTGIRKFLTTHRCGVVCKGLGLTCMNKQCVT